MFRRSEPQDAGGLEFDAKPRIYFLAASCALSSFAIMALRSVFADFRDFFVLSRSSFAAPPSALYDLSCFRSFCCRAFRGFVRAIKMSRETRRFSKSFMRDNGAMAFQFLNRTQPPPPRSSVDILTHIN